jgi:energy-coupling factor transporter ATP-binding protein EcfA2
LKNSPILLLDEATLALDSEAEEAIREALMHLMRGRTVIATERAVPLRLAAFLDTALAQPLRIIVQSLVDRGDLQYADGHPSANSA